jgi:Cu/Ag efflux pump CusA
MFNRLIAWSLHNRLIVLAITLVLFVLGGVTLRRMPADVFPEFAPPQVVIQTEAPGMAPTDVESLITYPLESAINGSPGVSAVRSNESLKRIPRFCSLRRCTHCSRCIHFSACLFSGHRSRKRTGG